MNDYLKLKVGIIAEMIVCSLLNYEQDEAYREMLSSYPDWYCSSNFYQLVEDMESYACSSESPEFIEMIGESIYDAAISLGDRGILNFYRDSDYPMTTTTKLVYDKIMEGVCATKE